MRPVPLGGDLEDKTRVFRPVACETDFPFQPRETEGSQGHQCRLLRRHFRKICMCKAQKPVNHNYKPREVGCIGDLWAHRARLLRVRCNLDLRRPKVRLVHERKRGFGKVEGVPLVEKYLFYVIMVKNAWSLAPAS